MLALSGQLSRELVSAEQEGQRADGPCVIIRAVADLAKTVEGLLAVFF